MTAQPTNPSAPSTNPRERLLGTAGQLFYQEGIRAIGVDRLVSEANVTRATFYRHFDGKDELVTAYLKGLDGVIRNAYRTAAGLIGEPGDLLRALIQGTVVDQVCGPAFRGCAFINAGVEYPDPDSPIHRAVIEHRSWFHRTLLDLFTRSGHPAPEQAARRLVLLRDGAMVGGYFEGPAEPVAALRAGLDELLGACESERTR
jgi:AcrR family transcriptional regulator